MRGISLAAPRLGGTALPGILPIEHGIQELQRVLAMCSQFLDGLFCERRIQAQCHQGVNPNNRFVTVAGVPEACGTRHAVGQDSGHD